MRADTLSAPFEFDFGIFGDGQVQAAKSRSKAVDECPPHTSTNLSTWLMWDSVAASVMHVRDARPPPELADSLGFRLINDRFEMLQRLVHCQRIHLPAYALTGF